MSIVNKIGKSNLPHETASRSSSAHPSLNQRSHTSHKTYSKQQNNLFIGGNAMGRVSNPERQLPHASEETLRKLIEMNENYLIEKVKISDVPTPPKYSHKIPSKTGNSQYNRRFISTNRHFSTEDSVPQRDNSGSIFKFPNCNIASYESTYHKDFDSKERAKSVTCKANTKYQRNEGPNFNQSSYHRDYSSVTQSPTISAKRIEVRLMGGGKLKDSTTYKQYYRMKTSQSVMVPQPIIHKDNRIFTKMENPQQISSYQSTFAANNKKNKVKVENCKPAQKYSPMPHSQKYKTEYREVFLPQTISRKKEMEWMSPAELKNYVMTILDN